MVSVPPVSEEGGAAHLDLVEAQSLGTSNRHVDDERPRERASTGLVARFVVVTRGHGVCPM